MVSQSEFSGGLQGWLGAGALALFGKAEGPGMLQPGEEMASGGTKREHSARPQGETMEKMEPGSLWKCLAGGQETMIIT